MAVSKSVIDLINEGDAQRAKTPRNVQAICQACRDSRR